ncbi:TolC family protein [Dawidia soli]|uniref:TolC family protein n=1 Tax=Dawidia soli TaxID=2782352 RepID=A0AAP2GJ26_9BACT|nr:TolC family protein [Dawidia soli]MBT1688956.1 TolC family protein [Dawidia soli]
MKSGSIKTTIRLGLFCALVFVSVVEINAQIPDSATLSLSLQQAIQYARTSNKSVSALKTEEDVMQANLAEAKAGALPRVHANASYQRYSNVRLYDGVLGNSHEIPKPPTANAGALGVETSVNLYAGGRQRSVVTDLHYRSELASINTREQEATIGLQVALQYLEMIKLHFQQLLIDDQVARSRERSKNIDALYANGKVTKSDVLRADVLLSITLLSKTTAENDYLISNQKLNTLLNLHEHTRIIPSDTMSLGLLDSVAFAGFLEDYSGTYALLKIQKNIALQENRARLVKSYNHPTVTLFSGYGLNYPNTLMFPPVAQTVAVGVAGVKVSYEISSLYQNKHRIKSVRLQETTISQQKAWIEDNVKQEARALAIKYNETMHRMHVIQKSIQQTQTNYDIQNTKYFNQLGLLTDLLEADNLYQETRFNYLQANIAALSIYYRLLFITGKI